MALEVSPLNKLYKTLTLSAFGSSIDERWSEEDLFVVDVGQEGVDDQELVVDKVEHDADVRLKRSQKVWTNLDYLEWLKMALVNGTT